MAHKTFFGFALADSMFSGNVTIQRLVLSEEDAKLLIADGVESCLNKSHTATVEAMHARGINVAIPETPPKVSLGVGDSLLVMGVRGLPRLEDRHHYTEEEIAGATFAFTLYNVVE